MPDRPAQARAFRGFSPFAHPVVRAMREEEQDADMRSAPAVLRAVAAMLAPVVIWLLTSAAPLPRPDPPWRWPVDGARTVVEPFRAPAHDYGPGHRGMDVAAAIDAAVRAPADGVIAFRGVVVDRPLITIEHAGGLVTTLEPVSSELPAGTPVSAGDEVGVVASGGHTPTGALHIGVRLDGVYINPMLLFGEVERAVLLPCCSDALTRAGARAGRSP